MELPEAREMAQHYFKSSLAPRESASFDAAWVALEGAGVHLTPAQLEQICSDGDTLAELVEALQEQLPAAAQAPGAGSPRRLPRQATVN
jgi:hypothetical protein